MSSANSRLLLAPSDMACPPSATRSAVALLSPATRSMVRLTGFSIAVTAGLIAAKGLSFPLADVWPPLAICGVLIALAAVYRWVRPAPNFVLCLKALAVLVGFSTTYSVLMYCLAVSGRPLGDELLASCDGWLGVSAPAVVRWTHARPAFALAMELIYFSLIPQTILLIVWLGLRNQRERLDKFLLRFILAALMTAVGFYLLPARGTYGAAYQLDVPAYCRNCLAHLDALRDGSRTLVTWRDAEGIITFPSFHTIWAVLLASAFVGDRRLFYPMALLNALVVCSTITTGMHYFTDVLAGLAVCAVVILATRRVG